MQNFKAIKAVLLDLDGTVYRGSEACPDAADSISSLLSNGFGIRYLTNNSAARPHQVTQKLTALEIRCEPDWVISSGMVAAQYLADGPFETYSYVGELGLGASLAESGKKFVDLGEPADAVAIGICRSFDYDLLNLASRSIRDGSQFVATNLDPTYPMEGGALTPGAGSLVAAVKVASGCEPIVIGKPAPTMVLQACDDLVIAPEQCIVVGDRMDTDISCGIAAGAHTWLVLTGVTAEIPLGQSGSPTLAELTAQLNS